MVEADSWETAGPVSFFRGQNPWYPSTQPDDVPVSPADGGPVIDVRLNALSSFTNLGRVGAYPNGRVGFAASTQSCNNGNVIVPWASPGGVGSVMQENHPGIVSSLYRISTDGNGIERMEQIGTSWVKHGFAALAEPFTDCAPCMDDPGTGQLSVGCGDTYGSFTNGDRFWLGPRDEWNAFTAEWDRDFSYFDGTPAGDGIRNQGSGGVNSVDRRIDVSDADLDVSGSTFLLEGMYLVRDEAFLVDNIGWRPVNITLNGAMTNWNTSTPGPSDGQTFGAAILSWGDEQVQGDLLPRRRPRHRGGRRDRPRRR